MRLGTWIVSWFPINRPLVLYSFLLVYSGHRGYLLRRSDQSHLYDASDRKAILGVSNGLGRPKAGGRSSQDGDERRICVRLELRVPKTVLDACWDGSRVAH